MKIFSLLICFSIISCSSQKVLQKQTHYSIDEKLLHELQTKSHLTRSPASVTLDAPELSAKRIYFKSLYEQYLAFTKISKAPRGINHCPAFHSDFVDAQDVEVVKTSQRMLSKVQETEKELLELCDKGVTANYYKFENLLQYHVHKKAFHQNPASIFSLLKIPVFENMYDLKLTHGVLLSHSNLIEVTKVHWFASYLEKFKEEETMVVKR